MPRPRKYDTDADRLRAFRDKQREAERLAQIEHEQLQLSVRRLRQAFASLPASLKGDQSAGQPVSMAASIDEVSVFLEALAALYPGSGPELTQGETKHRRKSSDQKAER